MEGGIEAGKAAKAEYTSLRYHQPADEWDAKWQFTGMVNDLQLLYQLGANLANSARWPAWSVDSEFRAARDMSTAERE